MRRLRGGSASAGTTCRVPALPQVSSHLLGALRLRCRRVTSRRDFATRRCGTDVAVRCKNRLRGDQRLMNRMEWMLSDDLDRLVDRLAAAIPAGTIERIRTTTHPHYAYASIRPRRTSPPYAPRSWKTSDAGRGCSTISTTFGLSQRGVQLPKRWRTMLRGSSPERDHDPRSGHRQ